MREKLNANDYLNQRAILVIPEIERTIVNRLKFRDDVQTDIRKFVLEHLKKHGKKMRDSLLLPKDWRKSTDLCAQSGANVL